MGAALNLFAYTSFHTVLGAAGCVIAFIYFFYKPTGLTALKTIVCKKKNTLTVLKEACKSSVKCRTWENYFKYGPSVNSSNGWECVFWLLAPQQSYAGTRTRYSYLYLHAKYYFLTIIK